MRGTELASKGIFVQAEDTVSVYGFNSQNGASSGFLAFPTEALGREYYVATFDGGVSQFGLVATADSTLIDIILPFDRDVMISFLGRIYRSGDVLSVNRNRLETVQIQAEQGYDLSGIKICSTFPVSVFSGNKASEFGSGTVSGNLVSMLTPVSSWGTDFATTPFPGGTAADSYDLIKVISSRSNTVINITDRAQPIQLQGAGDSQLFQLESSVLPIALHINYPVQVFQLKRKYSSIDGSVSSVAVSLIPPASQYSNYYRFGFPDTSTGGVFRNFIMVVIGAADKYGVKLNT